VEEIRESEGRVLWFYILRRELLEKRGEAGGSVLALLIFFSLFVYNN
jgi:hypothetical protein